MEIRALARSLVEEEGYLESLRKRLRAGKAPHMEPILFYYAYGRPRDHVEVSNPDGSLRAPQVVVYLPENERGDGDSALIDGNVVDVNAAADGERFESK